MEIEFEKCGETIKKKSFITMLKECEQILNSLESKEEKGRIVNLYLQTLLNDTPISEDREREQFEQLMALESDNPIINAFKKKILKEKFSTEGTIKIMSSVEKFLNTFDLMYQDTTAEDRQKAQQDIKNDLENQNKQSKLEHTGNCEEKN